MGGFVPRPGGRYSPPVIRHRIRAYPKPRVEPLREFLDPTALIHADSIYAGTIIAERLDVSAAEVGSLLTNKLYGSYLNVGLGVFGTLQFNQLQTTGTLPAGNIVIGSPIRMKIEGAHHRIRVWDSVGSLRVELGSLT